MGPGGQPPSELVGLEAHEDLKALVDEQAALRRVALLVAQGSPPEEVFAAVSDEVSRLFGLPPHSPGGGAVVRFDPGPELVVVGVSEAVDRAPLYSRWDPPDMWVSTRVMRTGRPNRLDDADLVEANDPEADWFLSLGIRSMVGSPIVVNGRLWGAITVNATETLPDDSADRLANFTELIATAIANTDARAELQSIAEEQAALRRLAELVAGGATPMTVFAAVAEEIGRLLAVDRTFVTRLDDHDNASIVAVWDADEGVRPPAALPVHAPAGPITRGLQQTGRPVRFDQYPGHENSFYEDDLVSAVAVPITVDGKLWGFVLVASMSPAPLPSPTEARLSNFADLLGTAIVNAQTSEARQHLLDQQHALRRVATLAASGAPQMDVLAAVAEEAGRLLSVDQTSVTRIDDDENVTVLAVWVAVGEPPSQVPLRVRVGPITRALQPYGRPVRIDPYVGDPAAGSLEAGVRSIVAAPITVHGALWGFVVVGSLTDHPPPPATEDRLADFTELLGSAIAEAESREAVERLADELSASRRRIVAASDEARRRIERDLHDGMQQRLISLGLRLRATESRIPAGEDELREEVAGVASGLASAVQELQELSRGIHPAILSRGGLASALRTLARRAQLPVELDVTLDERLPEPIEVAAYYVVSEALTNASKHAEADVVEISLARTGPVVRLTIRDDGRGGADATRGSGLVGLTDRVEALGGSLRVVSVEGQGTEITVHLPVDDPAPESQQST